MSVRAADIQDFAAPKANRALHNFDLSDSSTALQDSGIQSSSESLRHHIVEMAGKNSLQAGGRLKETLPLFKSSLASTKTLRRQLVEIDGNNVQRTFTLLAPQNKSAEIDLDIVKTQKRIQHHQQRHDQQREQPQYQPHPPPGPAANHKDKASALLLRRFRTRQEQGDATLARGANTAGFTHDMGTPSAIKRRFTENRDPQTGAMKTFSTQPKSVRFSKQDMQAHLQSPEQPSSGSSGTKADSHNSDRFEKATAKARPDSSKNVRVAEELYEIRGNAIPTPPPRQSSARRSGLFSASLEAFKRRLRISSGKYSQRLHGEEMVGTEDYVVDVQDPKGLRQTKDFINTPRNSPNDINNRPHQNINHSSQQAVTTHIMQLPQPQDAHTKLAAIQPLFSHESHPSRPTFLPHNHQPSVTGRSVFKPCPVAQKTPSEDSTNDDIEERAGSPHKPSHSPEGPQRFSYKLPADSIETKGVSFEEEMKQPLPNVKTYVVENDNTSELKNKLCQPVLLSMHNLKLHDSLQLMYERRLRRLERYQMSQEQQKEQRQRRLQEQQNAGCFQTQRLLKWLREVTEQSTIEQAPLCPVQISMESLTADSMSMEPPMLDHRTKESIFV